MQVYIKGRRLSLDPANSVAKGGEADIFRLNDVKALKLYKPPDHPDLSGDPAAQTAAAERIREHQTKLAAFPRNLPAHVISPVDLCMDGKGVVVGFTMRFVNDAEPLLRYSDKVFRHSGISHNQVLEIFRHLHGTLGMTHKAGVVIGDFNDLNVLVKGSEAFLIDADSYQYGGFQCRVFTERFLDPLLCDPNSGQVMLVRPYNPSADWYSFAVMLVQVLLFVGPYGGIYNPKDRNKRVPQNRRPLHRITVFDYEVTYPKIAIHYKALPDDFLHYLLEVFKRDRREPFPLPLLQMEWKTCDTCSAIHARHTCPDCAKPAPHAVIHKVAIRGTVTCTQIFATRGLILFAAVQDGRLRYLYWENDQFKRENGKVIMTGKLDPLVRYRIQGEDTLMGRNNSLVVIDAAGDVKLRRSVDAIGSLAMFDANSLNYFFTWAGQLFRNGKWGSEIIGQVLPNQTYFRVGEKIGFGFYRAGNLNVNFRFDPGKRGINDTVKLPPFTGQLVDSTCFFSEDLIWALFSVKERGRTGNRCYVLNNAGEVMAFAEATSEDYSWLGTIRGKNPVGRSLFTVTDQGIVKISAIAGKLQPTAIFPDTEPFVHTGCRLFPMPSGMHVVDARKISVLTIAGS